MATDVIRVIQYPATVIRVISQGPQGPAGGIPDIEDSRRTVDGYQEYSFDSGATWWRYAPVIVAGIPEWQWTGPLAE
jgi:hypothetical protein